MLLLVALAVVVFCSLVYFLLRLRSLSNEVQSLKDAAEDYVSLEEWEETVQPALENLATRSEATQRSLSLLAANVRGLQEGSYAAMTTPLEDEFAEEDEDDGLGPSEACAQSEDEFSLETAQASEGNLQAMIFSMARLLNNEAPELERLRAPPTEQEMPRTRLILGMSGQRKAERPPSSTTIEEQYNQDEDEDEAQQAPGLASTS